MIFEVTPNQIAQLDDTDLRQVIGLLCERELDKQGISTSSVTYGGNQNAADGGIDVYVDIPNKKSTEGFIPRNLTGIQVKAEKMPCSKILLEMNPKKVLRSTIIELGQKSGSYIIASSKDSTSHSALKTRISAMQEAVGIPSDGFDLHLDFYDNQRLATWVNQHPAMAAWVQKKIGLSLSGWQPFSDWSSSPSKLEAEYFIDERVRITGFGSTNTDSLDTIAGINKLRSILHQNTGIVRLVGLSGVGKTRLAQALFDSRVGQDPLEPHLVVYTDLSDEPDPVPMALVNRLHQMDQTCILIVDNCGIGLHKKLAEKIKSTAPKISLLTIEYDISDDEPEHTDVFRLEPASSSVIQNILEQKFPEITYNSIKTIVEFSEGNARIALALAHTAKSGETISDLKDSDLFKRLFRQKNEENPALLKAAMVCALVYSFDGETISGDEAELVNLANLAEQSVQEIHGHVEELYRRQLLQKRTRWRAILPHAIAHKLAKQAVTSIPWEFIDQHLIQNAPPRLIKSLSRRLGGLHNQPTIVNLVQSWLEGDGWLSKIENYNDLGITVFANIAPVTPEHILTAIEKAVERTPEIIGVEYPHRRKLVRILRSISYEASLFERSALLIAKFSEEVKDSNNSAEPDQLFKTLFHIRFSGTHATIDQRLSVVNTLLISGEERSRELAFSALKSLLACGMFSTTYEFDFGTRKRDYGLHPYGPDARLWFKSVFNACIVYVQTYPSLATELKELIAEKFQWIAQSTNFYDELVEFTKGLDDANGWPQGWGSIRGTARLLEKKKLLEEAAKFRALEDRLRPADIRQLIITYVLPPEWGSLDLAEVDFDDPDKYKKAREHVAQVCKDIGRSLATDPTLITLHVPAMLYSQSNRVGRVIQFLGENTNDPDRVWKEVLAVLLAGDGTKIKQNLLAPLIGGLEKSYPDKVFEFIDIALAKPALHPYIVPMIAYIDFTGDGFDRATKAVKIKSIPVESYRHFGYGAYFKKLVPQQIRQLNMELVKRDGGIEIAIRNFSSEFCDHSPSKFLLLPEFTKIGRELLADFTLVKDRQGNKARGLSQIVKTCFLDGNGETILQTLCQQLRSGFANYSISAYGYGKLVDAIAEVSPSSVLDFLIDDSDTHAADISTVWQDIRENRTCPLDKIDDDIILDWTNHNPAGRSLRIAHVLRPWHKPDEKSPLQWTVKAIKLIRHANPPEPVLDIFFDRFRPNSCSGSRADILQHRMALLDALENEDSANINAWASQAKAKLKTDIEQMRVWEAERDREEDERFEW